MAFDLFKSDTIARLRKLADDIEGGRIIECTFTDSTEVSRRRDLASTYIEGRVGSEHQVDIKLRYLDAAFVVESRESN